MIYTSEELTKMAKDLFKYERSRKRLDGWFRCVEWTMSLDEKYGNESEELKKAHILCEVMKQLPLEINENQIFVGSQDDAFAKTYALINPAFKVESFAGYCNPTDVFNDIEPNEEFSKERIEKTKQLYEQTKYVKDLKKTYADCEDLTKEVIYFVEQVTGHLIPDFRYALKNGVAKMIEELETKQGNEFEALKVSLNAVLILADRYSELAYNLSLDADEKHSEQYRLIAETLKQVPRYGARNLYEALQSYILLWAVMCDEQAPNPYAFSVGNADRIFDEYRNDLDIMEEAALLKHFLVFFNVADRSWAISQNLILSGRDKDGNDLTNPTTYALLEAYYDMNLPQPILSVKLHKNTPMKLYEEMGRFFFGAGVLTPSLFNDDSLFEMLKGVRDIDDLQDIAIAGCQEPLIMGKDNGNTTNSWLNLPKVLEMTLTGGVSLITKEKLADGIKPCDLRNVREEFYKNLEFFVDKMCESANGCSRAISNLKVPFLSCFMGGMESGIDTRDIEKQGTKYNGSGCLIHGTTVLADSFIAIDKLLEEKPEYADKLVDALYANFEGYEDLQEYLLSCHKFGNNIDDVDNEAVEIMSRVADIVASHKNYLGNPFRPDFSTPSTHLTYGYWVGATPDGRKSREQMNYGVDPLYGSAENGLGFRILSTMKYDFSKCTGGYASHLGIDPAQFHGTDTAQKGIEFYKQVIKPLFFNEYKQGVAPFYLYVNVTTPDTLRKVLADPETYAPSGVYIMRIHGTFVNFLDLSPAIQQDIIKRLDLKSTSIGC